MADIKPTITVLENPFSKHQARVLTYTSKRDAADGYSAAIVVAQTDRHKCERYIGRSYKDDHYYNDNDQNQPWAFAGSDLILRPTMYHLQPVSEEARIYVTTFDTRSSPINHALILDGIQPKGHKNGRDTFSVKKKTTGRAYLGKDDQIEFREPEAQSGATKEKVAVINYNDYMRTHTGSPGTVLKVTFSADGTHSEALITENQRLVEIKTEYISRGYKLSKPTLTETKN